MGRSPKRNIPDLIFGALSLALAGVCIYFAAYMVIRLQNMEDPPADMGLNFPAKKERRSEVEAVLVDPLITASIEPSGDAQPARRIRQPYTRHQPVLNYQLLTVIDGIAFVELTRIKGKEVWPVREGSILPAAGGSPPPRSRSKLRLSKVRAAADRCNPFHCAAAAARWLSNARCRGFRGRA